MIYAVDFDGTLCTDEYPNIGYPNTPLINRLIKKKLQGDIIILWTCRCGEYLDKAIEWCKSYGLEFNYINENDKDHLAKYGGIESRKIYADYYIDDKVLYPSELPLNL